ncbi:MAG: hypothetical protein VKM17_00700 [Cyanobacteriota bacterium]|nr:hypothetical protein [Cyanobacteriota bacterium]
MSPATLLELSPSDMATGKGQLLDSFLLPGEEAVELLGLTRKLELDLATATERGGAGGGSLQQQPCRCQEQAGGGDHQPIRPTGPQRNILLVCCGAWET